MHGTYMYMHSNYNKSCKIKLKIHATSNCTKKYNKEEN